MIRAEAYASALDLEELQMTKGFDPVFTPDSRALILGTWPSPKSFEIGFYYGHKQNRFWPLIALLTERPVPRTVEEKKRLIEESGLALWDTIESCNIKGASDASIKDVTPRDLLTVFSGAKIEAVFCNGTKSYEIYMKNQYPNTGIKAFKMPSTSPANAAFSFEKLAECWSGLREYISF